MFSTDASVSSLWGLKMMVPEYNIMMRLAVVHLHSEYMHYKYILFQINFNDKLRNGFTDGYHNSQVNQWILSYSIHIVIEGILKSYD